MNASPSVLENWISRLEQTAKIADEISPTTASRLRSLPKDIESITETTVVVVGEFNAGKSTLCNSLVHRTNLLPTAVSESSSCITEVRVGEREIYERYDRDGERTVAKEISVDEFRKLAALGKHEDSLVKLSAVIPKGSNGLLDHPELVLVDSPGLASLNTIRTATTLGYLPQADAIILVVEATKGLSASQLSFLENLTKHEARLLVVVLNCIDRLNHPEEQPKVLKDAAAKVDRYGIPALSILLVSAREAQQALEKNHLIPDTSGVPSLARNIIAVTSENKAAIAAGRIERPVRLAASELSAQLSGEFEGLSTVPEQLERMLLEEQKAADVQRRSLSGILEKSRHEVDSHLKPWKQQAQESIKSLRHQLDREVNSAKDLESLRALIENGTIEGKVAQTARSLIVKAQPYLKEAMSMIGNDLRKNVTPLNFEPTDVSKPSSLVLELPIDLILSVLDKFLLLIPGGFFARIAAFLGGSHVLKLLIGSAASFLLLDKARNDVKASVRDILEDLEEALRNAIDNTVDEIMETITNEVAQRGEAVIQGLRAAEARIKEGIEVTAKRRNEITRHLNTLKEILA